MTLRVLAIAAFTAAVSCYAAPALPPACAAGTLADYIGLTTAGCTIADDVTVSGFSLSVISGVPIGAADIDVIPTSTPGNRWGIKLSSSRFSVVGADSAVYQIDYVFDPTDIRSIRDVLSANSPVFPGIAIIDTYACRGAGFNPDCPTTPVHIQVWDDGIRFSKTASADIDPPQRILGIRQRIELDANGASSNFVALENSAAIPEPAAFGLVALGLSVLALRGRR